MWLSDLAVSDTDRLFDVPKTRRLADQLLRAVQAISPNLSEGYGCVGRRTAVSCNPAPACSTSEQR